MADIQVILEVLGAKDMEKAGRVTQTLENKIKSLAKQLERGRITNQQYQTGVQQLIRKNTQHAGSYKILQKDVQRYSGALQRSVNDKKRAEAAVESLTQDVQRNTSATRQAATAQSSFSNSLRRGQNQFASYDTATYRANQQTKRFASVGLQQAGYQVGDFAVQLQGGTNAAVAFGQQGSQLLGIFGAFGAVLGAGLAIGTAIIAPMIDAADKTNKLKEAVKDLDSAFNDLDNAKALSYFGQINSRVDNTIQRFRGLLELQREVAKQKRVEAFGELVSTFAPSSEIAQLDVQIGRLEELAQEVGTGDNERLQNMRSTLEDLITTRSELLKIQGDTREETAANLSQVRETLAAQGLMTPELRIQVAELADQLGLYRAASQAVEETKNNTESIVSAASTLNSELSRTQEIASQVRNNLDPQAFMRMGQEISGAADEAERLDEPFANALKDAKSLLDVTSRTARMMVMIRRGGAVDPQGFMRSEQETVGEPTEPSVGVIPSGGGGSAQTKTVEQHRQAVDKLIASYDEAQKIANQMYRAETILNDAVAAGAISLQEKDNVLAQYRESLRETTSFAEKMGKTLSDSLGGALMSVVDGTKSAADAFKDMARQILKQAFDLLVIQPIMDSITGALGGFGGGGSKGLSLPSAILSSINADGNAFQNGNQLTAYANGGVVNSPTLFPMANGAGLMGEAGPEAIMPLKRGKNGKLGVQTEGATQGNITIHQHFNVNGNGDEYIMNQIKGAAGPISDQAVDKIVRLRKTGSLKNVFG